MSDKPPPKTPREPIPPAPKPPRKRKPAGTATRAAPARPRKSVAAPPPPPPRVQPLRLTAAVAAATIAVDQALKWLVVRYLNLAELREMEVWSPYLNLRMAWNEGVNFGLFASGSDVIRWILIAIAVAVCVWVAVWVQRARPQRFGRIAAGLLIGGALGNVVDRLTYGAVADFLNMSLPGWRNPYSFNLADIAIFAGALGLVFQPAEKPRDDAGRTR